MVIQDLVDPPTIKFSVSDQPPYLSTHQIPSIGRDWMYYDFYFK